MSDSVAAALAQTGDPRTVVADPAVEYFGAVLTGDELVPGPGPACPPTTYDEWVAARADATA